MACALLRVRDFKCRGSLTLCVGAACPGVEVELEASMPDRIPPLLQIFTMQNMIYGMALANAGMLASIWFVRPQRKQRRKDE